MAENVFLFVPNLIGYTRIILAFISFYVMVDSPVIFVSLYLASALLDAFDGHAARALNQNSKFGAMLDMLTDRCTCTCLLVVLGHFYPTYLLLFQFLISLDMSSHWIHMYSSMLKGDQSHKKVDLSTNFFLRLYYTSKPILFVMCAGNELFFVAVYLLNFAHGPTVFVLNNNAIGLWTVTAYICLPICFLKQVISVIHLTTASWNIASYDVEERRKSTS